MHGVDADGRRNCAQRKFLGESVVEQFASLQEPGRGLAVQGADAAPSCFRKDLQSQSFHGQSRDTVQTPIFLVKPLGEPGPDPADNFGRPVGHRRMLTDDLGAGAGNVDVEDPAAGRSPAVRVWLSRRVECEGRGDAGPGRPPANLFADAVF
jgi:hypothetical protein